MALLAGNLNNQDPAVNFDQMFRFNAYNMVFSRINSNAAPFFDPKVYNIFSKSKVKRYLEIYLNK